MKKYCITLSLFLLQLLPSTATDLETGVPEAEGVSSRSILNFIESVERNVDALHSFVLMRHGKIVSEGWWAPYEIEKPHMLYSLSKSFTSTAIGIAIDESLLSLDDKVVSFFPDQLPESPGEHLKTMRIRDLLCMGTGHQNDTLPAIKNGTEADWVKVFLAQPVEHEPGTHFRYNTGATFMLSAILQKVTRKTLLNYLTSRLFKPLGIEGPTWETSPRGIHTGGYGLKVKTRDIAKLGQLYLQKGLWNGQRLLSEKWVEQASAKQISNGSNPQSDWNQGYGFQFWRSRHNAFRGDGAFGQYCIVMPDQDAVVAITSGLGNMQQVLDLVWKHLLPAMKSEPLEADPKSQAELLKKTASLQLAPVSDNSPFPTTVKILGQTYTLDENEKGLQSISLNEDKLGKYLLINNVHGEQRINCGLGRWQKGNIVFEKRLTRPVGDTNGRQSISASGAWKSADRYEAQIYFDETPFRLQMNLTFKGEQVVVNLVYNVSFGPKKWTLHGRLNRE